MRTKKTWISVLLIAVMLLCTMLPAFAAETDESATETPKLLFHEDFESETVFNKKLTKETYADSTMWVWRSFFSKNNYTPDELGMSEDAKSTFLSSTTLTYSFTIDYKPNGKDASSAVRLSGVESTDETGADTTLHGL